jgi:hypothetical protein
MDHRHPCRVAIALALSMIAALAAGAEDTRRPKDAAEAVQEGNVKNWVEYYERTREAQRAPAKPSPATGDGAPPKEPTPAAAPPR